MAIETNDAAAMKDAVDYYLEHSKVKNNGVREVSKSAFVAAIEKHGVSEEEFKKVQSAIDFETTAAAGVALIDVETKIAAASKEDLGNEEFRTNLKGVVRLPTPGGSTEVSVQAEYSSPIPFRGEGEPQVKTTFGRTRTTINTKGRIFKSFHEDASTRIRAALGVDDKD